jgi:predicted nucleic acid-binding protein
MIVLDTTVLVYAKGAEHALREPCRRLIAAVAEGEIVATTSVEVIQEFAHVRARRRGRADAAALGRDYAELLSPLLTITAAHLKSGLSLFEQLTGVGACDAVLAAAASDVGANALVSADRAFGEIPGLAHAIPDAPGIGALLS